MKKEFVEYLRNIGVTEVLQQRAADIYHFYEELCPENITGTFVTEYIREDGGRVYESLWFFSDNFAMEAKNFLTEDDFDITRIQHPIQYIDIKKTNYDFKKATEASRLYVEFHVTEGFGGVRGMLKASRENCDYLRDIISRYISPKAAR